MKNKYVLVVDPFSSGAVFANRIKALYGHETIALITNSHLPEAIMATFKKEDYAQVFYYKSLSVTVAEIESYLTQAPDFIICGSEPGVSVFDLLCDQWNRMPNILSLSAARRDKYLMQKQIKLEGIRYIPHFKSGDFNCILQWCSDNPFTEYVVKPIRSFGTEGVFFCKSVDEIKKAYYSLIGTLDYSGNRNSELLIEQKIEGIEYVVDAVSNEGEHFIVNIFRYIKEQVDGVPIYRQMITESVTEHSALVNYVKKVLTSLGIVNGSSHNEVIMSSDGPVLVESGARMHGGLGPRLVNECNSHSLIDLGLMARISSSDFREKTMNAPTLKKYAVEYFLSSSDSGMVKDVRIEEMCSPLSSYGFTVCKVKSGDHIEKTTDLVTSYGRVVLFNTDLAILEQDAAAIVEMERNSRLITLEN
ncbi:ATP-grasp domain-containing protein [Pectobacterium polaris]|uniref:ATP-grasp domain-containing protein n=1 Tax=Pectobacterium polaris TaxID=2042057 RepID=UPI002406A9D4|nr:ATP-grasp domain-containing protein [Pectobacterium polaris]MDG0800122.1 ATP-grasp domain-containing protein [Pectobacterium polaris]